MLPRSMAPAVRPDAGVRPGGSAPAFLPFGPVDRAWVRAVADVGINLGVVVSGISDADRDRARVRVCLPASWLRGPEFGRGGAVRDPMCPVYPLVASELWGVDVEPFMATRTFERPYGSADLCVAPHADFPPGGVRVQVFLPRPDGPRAPVRIEVPDRVAVRELVGPAGSPSRVRLLVETYATLAADGLPPGRSLLRTAALLLAD